MEASQGLLVSHPSRKNKDAARVGHPQGPPFYYHVERAG